MREGWEIKKLVELFDVKSSKRVHKADWKTEGVPFYRAREVVKLAQNGIVDNDLFISEELFEEFTKEKGAPKEGDIIISAVGTLGQCYLVKKTDRFYFKDASVLWFENISNVDVRYIEYAFKSDLIMKQVLNKSMGATVGTLTISRAKIIKIPIPTLSEQKQIVTILDKAFTAIDQAKANIEKNIENAKELFQSKLNDIFSQKGDGWKENTLGEVCEKTKNIKWQDFSNEEFEYVDLSSVSRETLSVTETATVNKENAPSRAKKIILEGDVIFATTRPTLRRATIIKEDLSGNLCSTGYVVLRPKENISSDWIFFYLLTSKFMDRMESLQRGASYPAVSDNDVKGSKLSVPISTLEEKKNILIMNNLQENTNFLIDNYINKLNDLEDLKKSVLQKAFAGELTSPKGTKYKKDGSIPSAQTQTEKSPVRVI
ncbi:restriction endonuclease subunit S [Polaribacter sp. R77954]|uniref:restriction endonuclease subunit S n=1 Tax=Polaribacter sp. R77954 TaxID=3093870 RepID=UPI0037CC282E